MAPKLATTKKIQMWFRYITMEVNQFEQQYQTTSKANKKVSQTHQLHSHPISTGRMSWMHRINAHAKNTIQENKSHIFLHVIVRRRCESLLMRKYLIYFMCACECMHERKFILHFKCHTQNRINTINGNGRNSKHKNTKKMPVNTHSHSDRDGDS